MDLTGGSGPSEQQNDEYRVLLDSGFQTEPGAGPADPMINSICSWVNGWSPGTVHRIFHQEGSGSDQNLLGPLGGPVKLPQNRSGTFRICLRELCGAISRMSFRTFWSAGSRASAEPPSGLTWLLWSRCRKSLENRIGLTGSGLL